MGDFTPQIFLNAWTASTLVWSFLQLIYHVLNRNFQKVACYLLQLVISWSSCQNMVDKISISISSNEGYKRSDLLQNCCWPPNHSVTSTICRIFLKPLEIFSVLRNIIKCLAWSFVCNQNVWISGSYRSPYFSKAVFAKLLSITMCSARAQCACADNPFLRIDECTVGMFWLCRMLRKSVW